MKESSSRHGPTRQEPRTFVELVVLFDRCPPKLELNYHRHHVPLATALEWRPTPRQSGYSGRQQPEKELGKAGVSAGCERAHSARDAQIGGAITVLVLPPGPAIPACSGCGWRR